MSAAEDRLAATTVAASVPRLRPDYRAVLLTVEGVVPGPSDATESD